MKVLHVVSSMNPKYGGVSQAVKSIIRATATFGIHNEIVCLDSHDSPHLIDSDIVIHALNDGKGPWRYNNRLGSWLNANLSYFDVVIMHALWQYPGYAVRKALKSLGSASSGALLPRLFVMPHGMLDPYFQHAPGRKLKALRNQIYWKLIESKLINECEAILFTCQEELSLAAKTFQPYHPKSTAVVGMVVEPPPFYLDRMKDAFENACRGLNNAPYLLFLSRIDEKKGVDLLINAYLNVLKSTEEDGERSALAGLLPKLVIAGPGQDTPFGRKMLAFVEANRELHQMILFPGMLAGDAKWGAFYGADAFILPSHQENFGIAVVEALACGKPVLISDQVNIWREIDEAGGCYVSGDTLEGSEKLLEFWMRSSYKQRKAMGRNALYAYKHYFSMNPTAIKILDTLTRHSSPVVKPQLQNRI
ncbi:MAG: glycosyltransferase [Pedobacter sp.]|nr:MAG: glycosyltransferase [Pedobacter sp.]